MVLPNNNKKAVGSSRRHSGGGGTSGGGSGPHHPYRRRARRNRSTIVCCCCCSILAVIAALFAIGVVLHQAIANGTGDAERMLSTVQWNAQRYKTLLRHSHTHTHSKSHSQTFRHGAMALTYPKPHRHFDWTQFTLDEFVVNGVNLAQYGFEIEASFALTQRFALFDNFEMEGRIEGHETWADLVKYRQEVEPKKSLVFYLDKVAQKRWMKAAGIPIPNALVLKYRHELLSKHDTNNNRDKDSQEEEEEEEKEAILSLLPDKTSYVAKPTHKSMATDYGVWLVRYDPETNRHYMQYRSSTTIAADDEATTKDVMDDKEAIAQQIVQDLHHDYSEGGSLSNNNDAAATAASLLLQQVQPGFVVEERFSAPDSDWKPAYEFKILVIWGRVYLAHLKRGDLPTSSNSDHENSVGLLYRNGTMIKNVPEDNCDWKTIPQWLWLDQVVELAEHLAQNKDMLGVNILVGVPSSSSTTAINNHANVGEHPKVHVAVSETEFQPTMDLEQPELLEEAARLWMAGYQMGIHKLTTNDEVPRPFLENGYLSTEDANKMNLREGDKWFRSGASSYSITRR